MLAAQRDRCAEKAKSWYGNRYGYPEADDHASRGATERDSRVRQVSTGMVALDGPGATAVGLLLSRTGTAGIADAHVVLCAQRSGQAVVTSDPEDLRRIAPALTLVVVEAPSAGSFPSPITF
jgi:predicted nucleic acid-binding protein